MDGTTQNGVEHDRNHYDANITVQDLVDSYMLPFQACVEKGKVSGLMCSYNSINGVPTCADPNLMNNVLRKQWGWGGWVVSDYDAYAQVYTDHNYTKTMAGAAAAGLNAGLDQEGGGTSAIDQLLTAIDQKLTSKARVATAFGRLMRARVELGMFDPPSSNAYDRIGIGSVRTAAATALNKRAALEGITLLKNGGTDGKAPLLPLKLSTFAGKPGSLFVAGPIADNAQNALGNYDCGYTPGPGCVNANTSIVGGLRNGGTGLSKGEVVYVACCSSTAAAPSQTWRSARFRPADARRRPGTRAIRSCHHRSRATTCTRARARPTDTTAARQTSRSASGCRMRLSLTPACG